MSCQNDQFRSRASFQFMYSSGAELPPFYVDPGSEGLTKGTVAVKRKRVEFSRVPDENVPGGEEWTIPYTKYPGTYGSDYVYHLAPDGSGVYEQKVSKTSRVLLAHKTCLIFIFRPTVIITHEFVVLYYTIPYHMPFNSSVYHT